MELVQKLKQLKENRSGLKGMLTYHKNKLDDLKSLGEMQSTLYRIREIYRKFDFVQSEIEVIDFEDRMVFQERKNFEDEYGRIEAKILDSCNSLSSNNRPSQQSDFKESVNTHIPLKLPQIDLMKFDGNKLKWLDFRDNFINIIHSNVRIANVSKFYYLISCVKEGSAWKHIQSLPVTNENYETAWKILYDEFNNEVAIQKEHIKQIYDIKKCNENSVSSLSFFIQTLERHMSALKSLNVDTTTWDLFLSHHILEKLDHSSKIQVIKNTPQNEIMSYTDMIKFLKARVCILEAVTPHSSNERFKVQDNSKFKQGRSLTTSSISCIMCKESHILKQCPKFTNDNMTPSKRYEFVKKHNLCTNCLQGSHRVNDCSSGTCQKCSSKHNTLLHFTKQNSSNPKSNVSPSSNISSHKTTNTTPSVVHEHSNQSIPSNQHSGSACPILSTHDIIDDQSDTFNIPRTILGTVVVWIEATNGKRMQGRAILDSCSNYNFVSEKFAQMLKSDRHPISFPVAGINGHISYIKSLVDLTVESRVSEFSHKFQFLVIPRITGNLPNAKINFDKSSLSKSVKLADPLFHIPGKVDLLIGVEHYYNLILSNKVNISRELPSLQNTVFGYLVAGKLDTDKELENFVSRTNSSSTLVSTSDDVHSLLQKFWQIEQIPSNPTNSWSTDEKACENHYAQNVIRSNNGRYSVSLPIKPNIQVLGDSQESALRQFLYLEKRLDKNPDLQKQYNDFMSEYISLNHMELVSDVTQVENSFQKSYFLPHHSVIKQNSTTTKLRVVFNASSKTSSGLSLNDVMFNGPTIQQDLLSIVLRFRKYIIGITADIAKMYRQVTLQSTDRDLHRIWWRDSSDPDNQIQCYRLKTVTYGTTSAPFLAVRTLHQLANDENASYPAASIILKRDFYVDDLLTGTDTADEAMCLKSDLIELLKSGGFDLRKWASNCEHVSSHDETVPSDVISILGLQWNTKTDNFNILLKDLPTSSTCTKRIVLSQIAQLFDPLGFIAPVVFIAKLLMQSLWEKPNLSWDEQLPSDITHNWNTFKQQLSCLRNIQIPRCIKPCHSMSLELHAFGDASEKGYGCVVYIRAMNNDGTFCVKLVCAKSRVAPLKRLTIPKLELCAAHLVTTIVNRVMSAMEIVFEKIYLWSDSEITLLRIKSSPSKLPVFEANRISAIQDTVPHGLWLYVPTDMNPADLVSRGVMPEDLVEAKLWWQGPSFLLKNKSFWPKSPNTKLEMEVSGYQSIEPSITLIVQKEIFSLIDESTCYTKLIRTTALILRFINNCRIPHVNASCRTIGELTTTEINSALMKLVGCVQRSNFQNEIKVLCKNNPIPKSSRLRSLCPFIDEMSILRVGGRLKNSDLKYDNQHQILLPSCSNLSYLLALHTHTYELSHGGAQTVLYNLRLRFWIINGRNLCRKIIHNCIRCFRVNPKSVDQLMGQLPSSRVTVSTPFHHTGVDLCGPFNIKYKIRTKCTSKAYIASFVCFSTKAVHFEVVDDLSTQSFLAALSRFVNRRGRPGHLYSDNATNFIGAKNELDEMQRFVNAANNKHEVLKYCADQQMQWHNIPPRSPHFGGLWEATIKSAKFHLKRVIGTMSFTTQELNTLIIEIESCLNSRPLTPMSSDPNDFTVLTPGHFLIGKPLKSLPNPTVLHLECNRLSHFQKIQQCRQQFWERWRLEVLGEMQQRAKWSSGNCEIKVGMLVLLKEENVPPLKWVMGRIVELYPGKDEITRVVRVKTSASEFKRAVAKICILPMDEKSIDILTNLKECEK